MADGPTWNAFKRDRDMPMLGADPEAWKNWKPVDNGKRPPHYILPLQAIQYHANPRP